MLLLLLMACANECRQACVETTRRVASCLESWPATWEELGAENRQDFRSQCEEDWEAASANLESREIDEALESCQQVSLTVPQTSCDTLRALYLE